MKKAQFANTSIRRAQAPQIIVKPGKRIVTPAEFDNDWAVNGKDPQGGYDQHIGKVFFANEGWFDATFYSEPLTNYLVGWKDPNDIEKTLQFYAPAVPVPGRLFEYKLAVNSEEFLSEVVDDERAIGADFKNVTYTGTSATAKTLNRGLMTIVDLDRVAGGSMGGAAPPPWQQSRVAKLTRRLYRNSTRRAVTALDTAANSTGYIWSAAAAAPGSTAPNPDMDIQAELIAATDVSGIRPNRVGFGDTSWLYRNQCYGAQNNPGGFMGYTAGAAEDKMAAMLQVDQVHISRERYQTTASAKTQIVAGSVYAFYAQDDVDTEDPSNIKRFTSTFDQEQGGGLFRVYVQQISSKLVAISVEFYEIIVVTYTGGIRKLAVTNQ